MPSISVRIPDAKADPMVRQLSRQFAGLQKSLQAGKGTRPSEERMLKAFSKQSDGLMKAMERMLRGFRARDEEDDEDDLAGAITSLKRTMAGLPGSLRDGLKGALNGQMKQRTQTLMRPQVTVHPTIKVSVSGLSKRLDRLEAALASGKLRNRTFGSNY